MVLEVARDDEPLERERRLQRAASTHAGHAERVAGVLDKRPAAGR
ncbi:MAG: hypothetical protein QOD55_1776 [Solirubrobacteraceae bacterium]|jgi:hypothetical protein|nr:hypothetical protein [Solirubrobacteraceae bacterium]MEA2289779.1 hypothetical protein [Solirubrobacteraceae bacterium]